VEQLVILVRVDELMWGNVSEGEASRPQKKANGFTFVKVNSLENIFADNRIHIAA